MKSFSKALTAFLLIVFTLTGCQSKATPSKQGLKIVTSFYPIYAMVEQVSGDLNDVRMIQSGSGIHGFEPSVADVQAIYDADAFIYHSRTLETWAGRLDPSLASSDVLVIEASQGMSLERVAGLEDMDVKEFMDEASLYDPHTWVDPILVAEEVGLIAEQLSQLDPENAASYQKNAQEMITEATALVQRFQPRFDQLSNKTFVTQHTAFSYLARRFGLTQLGIASVTDQEPSPRQLTEIKDFIDRYKVETIFTEKQASDKLAKTLASSTKVQLKVLDPLESDPQNNLSYLDNLAANLDILATELDE